MTPNFVTAIIHNAENEVLMIEVSPDDSPESYWTLPGGRVEKGETAEQALMREVLEETGMTLLDVGQLAYRTEIKFDDRLTVAEVYAIHHWQGIIYPNDPEDEIIQAAWMPIIQAIQHLAKIDYAPMSEPPIAYLNHPTDIGKKWHYRVNGDGAQWVSNE